MNLSKKIITQVTMLLLCTLVFVNCTEDDDMSTIQGKAQFEITDAPIDDTNIEGTFVTITAVKVDGEVISDFDGTVTIDLMAYQNGDTKALGFAELEAGTYSNVSLVLDYTQDADGNAPGCYVLTNDNVKHDLQATANSTSELSLNTGDFTVEENSTTNLVIDFDVRKAITNEGNASTNDQYNFVTEAELRTSLRMVNKATTARVEGEVNDATGVAGDRIVVYAYKKGTFNSNTETTGQGSSDITFKNAVSSAVVANDGSFNISFLESGEYELHYVGYEDNNNDGKLEAKGMLQVNALGSLDILGLQLDASANVNVEVNVLAVIPF
ncbi:MAG: DUF4382 domain-containing protein [Bacteroidota bacterium]